jgi:hypothetical protein
VEQVSDRVDVAEVAACTATAVHGRDHDHGTRTHCCLPHAVEVVYLGHRALTVCHDCRADYGFLPRQEAEHMAKVHRNETRVASVWLPGALAT